MEVHLTPDQEAFIRQRISTGRFATADEALQAAVSLLEERERPEATGADLVAAMQASPYRDIELEPSRSHLPVRDLAI
jgi:putative addiction module CopG family antidote